MVWYGMVWYGMVWYGERRFEIEEWTVCRMKFVKKQNTMWILNYGKFSVFDKISPVSSIQYPLSII
jgi:uncharacterized protein YkuJ